jgi:hypothetical protein
LFAVKSPFFENTANKRQNSPSLSSFLANMNVYTRCVFFQRVQTSKSTQHAFGMLVAFSAEVITPLAQRGWFSSGMLVAFPERRTLFEHYWKRNVRLRLTPPVASLPTLSVFPLRSKLRGKKAKASRRKAIPSAAAA